MLVNISYASQNIFRYRCNELQFSEILTGGDFEPQFLVGVMYKMKSLKTFSHLEH